MMGDRYAAVAGFARSAGFAVVLFAVLLVLNLILNPARYVPGNWGTLIGLAAPLIGASLASAPVILAGRGGIDISVGPAMGFVNAIVIQVLFLNLGISSPAVLIPAALLTGLAIGAVNGFLATIVRIQPIVATLVLPSYPSTPAGPRPPWARWTVRSRRRSASKKASPAWRRFWPITWAVESIASSTGRAAFCRGEGSQMITFECLI